MLNYIGETLNFLITMPLRAGERIFWLFMLASILLALWVSFRQSSAQTCRQRFKEAVHQVFAWRLFLQPSALIDYQLAAFNALLRFGSKGIQTTASIGLAVVVSWILTYLAPSLTLHQDKPAPALVTVLYTFCLFVSHDFTRFGLHFLQHRIPFLWRFHAVHHSATVLNPITLYRVHPFDILLFNCRHILTVGLVGGFFVYLFGGQLTPLTILGVEVFGFIFNIAGANLRHSHIWISFGRWESLVLSPAQHQIHHSNAKEHFDRNFGSCLAIWDRLWGTFLPASAAPQGLTYGVSGTDHSNLWRTLTLKTK